MSKAKVFIIFALLGGSILLLSCSNPNDDEEGSSSSSRASRSSSSRAGQSSSSGDGNLSSSYSDSSSSDGEISSDDSSSSDETDPQSSSSDDPQSSSSGSPSSSSSANPSSSSSTNPSSSSRSNSSSSSSNAISSSSSAVVTGELTDSRDNKKYKTVVIGTQTWMAENLNYKPSSVSGRLDRCYAEGGGQDDWLKPGDAKIEQNCQKYGRLYDWATATASVCPQGWHLPSRAEWNELKDYVFEILWENYEDEDFGWDVGTKLKATSGWKDHSEQGCGNGVDTYGFKAIGSGYCYSCDKLTSAEGSYSGIGNRGDGDGETARWWSTTEHASNKGNAYRFEMTYSSNVLTERSEDKTDLYSVRCVKN